MSELTYTRSGDYLIPDLSLTEQPQAPLGKYGRMRKDYLKEHRPVLWNSLLLSENAFVQSSPQLEIYADDVVCSHGATVGSLDENEQFYMRSRGISLEEARRLQILSFLSPVLEGLPEKKIITIFASALG